MNPARSHNPPPDWLREFVLREIETHDYRAIVGSARDPARHGGGEPVPLIGEPRPDCEIVAALRRMRENLIDPEPVEVRFWTGQGEDGQHVYRHEECWRVVTWEPNETAIAYVPSEREFTMIGPGEHGIAEAFGGIADAVGSFMAL